MRVNVLIFFLLICNISDVSYTLKTLGLTLSEVTAFFEKLKHEHEGHSLNADTLKQIDDKIDLYMKKVTNSISHRQKRESDDLIDHNSAIDILENFENISIFNLQEFQDYTYFTFQLTEIEKTGFIAGITSEGISLYQLKDYIFNNVGKYTLFNGKRIIVENCNCETVVVTQNNEETLSILTFTYTSKGYMLHFSHILEVPTATDIYMWCDGNQLYLGVVLSFKVSIYAWLGQYFDLKQELNFRAKKLHYFHNNGFMYLTVVGSPTVILKFDLHFGKFIIKQTLSASQDVTTFHVYEDYFSECFMVLSKSLQTVFYKAVNGYFIPFQQIQMPGEVFPLINCRAVAPLFINNGNVIAYQYDGWKFIQMHIKIPQVYKLHAMNLFEDNLLIAKSAVGQWKLLKPMWSRKKLWQTLRDEIKAWCIKANTMAERLPKTVPELKMPIRISKGHIKLLRAENVNGHSAKEIIEFGERVNQMKSQLKAMNDTLKQKMFLHHARFKTLRAKKVNVICTTQCRINNVVVEKEDSPLAKLRYAKKRYQNLQFKKVKVDYLNNFKCPIPAINPENLYVEKLINNITLSDLKENALKKSGNQIITGEHIYNELEVINATMPLDIATRSTNQTIRTKEIRVKELHLTEGGLLLPLNGQSTDLRGSLTIRKLNLRGLVHLQGPLRGEGVKALTIKEMPGTLVIPADRIFRDITIINTLKAKDIRRKKNGTSLKYIFDNGVPIDTSPPMHLKFSSRNVEWQNVTLKEHINWVTAHSKDQIVISGVKRTTRNVLLTPSSYAKLPPIRINFPLCGVSATAPDIKLSKVFLKKINVKNLNSINVFGARKLNSTIFDPSFASSIEEVDLSKKYFTGVVTIKNVSAINVKGFNFKGLQEVVETWFAPNVIRGPITATRLKTKVLEAAGCLHIPLPTEIQNVIVKGNLDVKTINNVDIASFMQNVVKVDEAVSLQNITFKNGFETTFLNVSHPSVNFTCANMHSNLHSKRILGRLETQFLNTAYPIICRENHVPLNYVIHGNAIFHSEPILRNINNVNLRKLYEKVYMTDEEIVISGKNFTFKNMTIDGNSTQKIPLYTPLHRTWSNISQNLLSKTKPQTITVPCFFRKVIVPNVRGSNSSFITTTVPYITDFIDKSLKKNKSQVISGNWHFPEMIISGCADFQGKINGLDLKKDVVRHDVARNIVTGRKTIKELAVEHLRGLNFDAWAKNVVTTKDEGLVVIKGLKVFNTITIGNLSLEGKIMGVQIEDALLRSGEQVITGTKTFNGDIKMSTLILDGLVNDVNLTNIINTRMKKRKSVQRLKTPIVFQDTLEILGNVTFGGLYNGVNLSSSREENAKMRSLENRLMRIERVMEAAEAALENRAYYLDKFEFVENMNMSIFISASNQCANIHECQLKNMTVFCDDVELRGLNVKEDFNNSRTIQLVTTKDNTFVVSLGLNCVSIYVSNEEEESFRRVKEFCIPNVLGISAESYEYSLWIVVQLQEQMLALHYDPWGDVQRYILPSSDILFTGRTPNKELLMLRSDGIWILPELGAPRCISEVALIGKVETFSHEADYYIKLTNNNITTLMRAQYVGSK